MRITRNPRTIRHLALAGVLCLGWLGCEEKNAASQELPKEQPSQLPEEAGGTMRGRGSEVSDGKPTSPPASVPSEDLTPPPKQSDSAPEPKVVEDEPASPADLWTVAHAGFASKLPADTDYYMDLRRLMDVWKWLEASGVSEEGQKFLGNLLEGSEFPEEIDKFLDEGIRGASDLFGEEVFLAGRGMTWGWETMMGMHAWISRAFGRTLAEGLSAGNMELFLDDGVELEQEMVENLSKWFEDQLGKAGGFPRVALYTGGRVSDGKRRAELLKWLRDVLTPSTGEVGSAKSVAFEKSGVKWTGFEIRIGALEEIEEDEVPSGFDLRVWEKMLEQIAEWSVTVVCAEVGDYLVLAAGNGPESIELSEDIESSLAKSTGFRFFEQFGVEEIASLSWTSKELIGAGQAGVSYLPFFEGALEGIKGGKLERGAQMVEALTEFNSHWQARGTGEASEYSGVLLAGEEIRLETRGGWLGAGLDLKTPLKFSGAFAALENVPFVRAHWKMNADHVRHGHEQVDAGMRLVRLIGEEVMAFLIEEAGGAGEGEQYQRWGRDLSKGLSDLRRGYGEHFSKAFGEEGAFVMDLRGEMIPAVGVEEEVVQKGRIPRVAWLKPVVRRQALSESWDTWESALTNLFGILAESLDQPIPFPSTMTAEKNDLRTYFFPMPFATDDFLPSVSVSDELYIVGSSKTLSENLYEASLREKEGEEEAGLWIDVHADQLWDFCETWLEVYEENRAAAEEIEEDEQQGEGALQAEPAPGERRDRGNKLREEEGKAEEEELLERVEKERDREEDASLDPRLGLEGGDPGPQELNLEDPFSGLSPEFEPDLLRGWIDKLRILRGIRVHRRLEDGVPRMTLRIRVER